MVYPATLSFKLGELYIQSFIGGMSSAVHTCIAAACWKYGIPGTSVMFPISTLQQCVYS